MNNDLTQQNIDRFNEIATDWDTDPQRAATTQAVANAIREAVPLTKRERALEFGCGTGMITLALANAVARVVAMDSSSEMLAALKRKMARLKIDNVEALEGALPDTPSSGHFDLILSSMTLHHIADTQVLLDELFGLLRPGGWLALADLDREDGSFHGDQSGIAHHGFDRDELADWLSTSGFVNCRFSTAHTMEKEIEDATTRQFTIFLVRAQQPK
jgi:2-polyprenyl-3-methyl-5-hydroxy-6-metoxy-1,4-benzoquinol methylase